MRKFDEVHHPESCWNKAGEHERLFILLGRDAAAPATIRYWARERIRLGLNKAGDAQLANAEIAAGQMDYDLRIGGRPMPIQVQPLTADELKFGVDPKVGEAIDRLAKRTTSADRTCGGDPIMSDDQRARAYGRPIVRIDGVEYDCAPFVLQQVSEGGWLSAEAMQSMRELKRCEGGVYFGLDQLKDWARRVHAGEMVGMPHEAVTTVLEMANKLHDDEQTQAADFTTDVATNTVEVPDFCTTNQHVDVAHPVGPGPKFVPMPKYDISEAMTPLPYVLEGRGPTRTEAFKDIVRSLLVGGMPLTAILANAEQAATPQIG